MKNTIDCAHVRACCWAPSPKMMTAARRSRIAPAAERGHNPAATKRRSDNTGQRRHLSRIERHG